MLVILSSGYVSEDLQVELGKIPPCMLPVGGKLLLEHQIESMPEEVIYLTLPLGYCIDKYAAELIQRKDIRVSWQPHDLTIGEVLAKILVEMPTDKYLNILFGDTLILDYKIGNYIGISKAIGYYQWSVYNEDLNQFGNNSFDQEHNFVFNGFIAVSGKNTLLLALIEKDIDLIEALNMLVADNSLSVFNNEKWYDFGHLQTYYNSKKLYTNERSFNSLNYERGYFVKTSFDEPKVKSEYKWFCELPEDYGIYLPSVIKRGSGYCVEYLNFLTLAELYTFGRTQNFHWKKILESCFEFIGLSNKFRHSCEYVNMNLNWSLADKTVKRLNDFSSDLSLTWEYLLKENDLDQALLFGTLDQMIGNSLSCQGVIHGDFCFSNILYDFRSQRIKVIDPRGCDFSGVATHIGPVIYDVAKLAHSAIGRYDDIMAGKFEFATNTMGIQSLTFHENNESIQELFVDLCMAHNISIKAVYGAMIHLFISMVPLHCESKVRQAAFIVNAFRLYRESSEL